MPLDLTLNDWLVITVIQYVIIFGVTRCRQLMYNIDKVSLGIFAIPVVGVLMSIFIIAVVTVVAIPFIIGYLFELLVTVLFLNNKD